MGRGARRRIRDSHHPAPRHTNAVHLCVVMGEADLLLMPPESAGLLWCKFGPCTPPRGDRVPLRGGLLPLTVPPFDLGILAFLALPTSSPLDA